MKCLVIGKYNVAFCGSINELASVLYYRQTMECRVVVGDDWETLLDVAHTGQQRLIDCCTDDSLGQMALPAIVTGPLSLTYSTDTTLPAVEAAGNEAGAWGISALNGFCIANSSVELCQIIAGGEMVYLIAQWFPSREAAVIAARVNYTQRFYYRYRASAEQSFLPQSYLEFFVDSFFEEREKRRKAQLKQLQERALRNWERGWL